MIKNALTTLLLAIIAVAGQAQSQQQEEQNLDTTIHWKLEGTVDNAEPTDTLYVIDMETQRDFACLQVKDGKIIPTDGTLNEPAVCGIMTKDRRRWISAFVLENGTANIHVDIKKNYLQHIGGTPINDEMNAILTESRQNTSIPRFSVRISTGLSTTSLRSILIISSLHSLSIGARAVLRPPNRSD